MKGGSSVGRSQDIGNTITVLVHGWSSLILASAHDWGAWATCYFAGHNGKHALPRDPASHVNRDRDPPLQLVGRAIPTGAAGQRLEPPLTTDF